MRGLDPRIHLLRKKFFQRRWIAGSSPAMTAVGKGRVRARIFCRAPHTSWYNDCDLPREHDIGCASAPAACGTGPRQRTNSRWSQLMWTLIIITLLLPNNAASTGASGAGVTTTMLSFADQQKCLAAAEAIGVPDFAQIPSATAPVSGIYRIVTRCVARDRGALLRPGDGIFRPDGSMAR
jgi:hypothetical protein